MLFISTLLIMASCGNKQNNTQDEIVEITPSFIEAVHQFDELYPFSEGMAAVKKDGKFGYINTKGELVIPCKFCVASDFSEGIAIVETGDTLSFLMKDGEIKHTQYKFDPMIAKLGYCGKSYMNFNDGICVVRNSDGDNVFLNKNLEEVEAPLDREDGLSDNNYEVFEETVKDNFGNDIKVQGLKDKTGKTIIPAQYYYINMGENGVVLAALFAEDAESTQQPEGYPRYGLLITGYIDYNGNSTFTDADMGKIEGYKEAQQSAMALLKLREEDQARLEEEQRQEEQRRLAEDGREISYTISADFDKYHNLTNRRSELGDASRFINSFETAPRTVPQGKRLKYLYYKNNSSNVFIGSDIETGNIRIDVYSRDNRLVAQHNLKTCGEFNITDGESFRIKVHDAFLRSGSDFNNGHLSLTFYFKEYCY